ncbi:MULTISPECIES: DinB family protein [Paenibacillus]|uniref:Damage-inducible protein DinB n=1 Tax=Paenibacillus lactis TaxID=228574 RepID=A0ABS4FH38_9BACL|nr:DinB family protein [Paenibacillus lactis]MBP1895573.1 putative damage-inducible protein DinB [Paenibacillus lactis]GIO93831.1 hypothetical protein J31TS3_50580 [Paenibacillus lactis]HAG00095.1 damage-inducible protein DinB [Paenibacillus lactis]
MYMETEQQLKRWLRHRGVLQQLLEEIRDEHLEYKPWPNAMTLGKLIVHMAASSDMFLQSIKHGAFSPPTFPTSFESISDIREIVQASTNATEKGFAELTEAQLEQPLDFNGFVAPGSVWLGNMVDHEIHHKGQLFTYARSVGIEKLPFFIVQPPKA